MSPIDPSAGGSSSSEVGGVGGGGGGGSGGDGGGGGGGGSEAAESASAAQAFELYARSFIIAHDGTTGSGVPGGDHCPVPVQMAEHPSALPAVLGDYLAGTALKLAMLGGSGPPQPMLQVGSVTICWPSSLFATWALDFYFDFAFDILAAER
jgi:hypothetical protein